MTTVLDEFIVRIAHERAVVVEERIALHVRPRPRWMPEYAWRRLLARMLVVRSEQ